jgi:hypothetical protein
MALMDTMADDDLDRENTIRLLREQARRATPYPTPREEGGVTGNVPTTPRAGIEPDPGTPPTEAPRFPVPGTAPGDKANAARPNYAYRGFDQGKMANPYAEQSEKYKIGNVMQKYDPKGGVTQELIDELNALGIAEFSGSGGNLTVKNTKNDPRFGSGGTGDVVYAYDAQNQDTAWQPWLVDDGGGMGAGAAGGSRGFPMTMSGGDTAPSSFETIQSLMPTDTDFMKKLQDQIAQALGGYPSMDRDQLLRMLEQR